MAQLAVVKVFYMCFILLGYVLSKIDSAAPIVGDLPNERYVGENESGQRKVYDFSILDPNGDSFTVAETVTAEQDGVAIAGPHNQFEIKYNSLTGGHELWTTGTAFNFATVDRFFISVEATDTNSETSDPEILKVSVVENEQVTVNNVEGTSNTLSLNALSTGQGVVVKTVDATSNLGSRVEYSMTSDPSYYPEFFTIDSSSGEITSNRPLKYLNASLSTIYLDIEAYDAENHIIVYSRQTVQLTNQNTICSITNMINGLSENKIETLAAGTVLFQATLQDPDSSQSKTPRFECTPKSAEDTFEIDADGTFKVATGRTMDYETNPSFTCNFYCDDGIEESFAFVYDLTVENDNEAPIFSDIMYYVTTYEGSKGSVTFDPTLDCEDPDTGDSISYDFQTVNNSDYFTIDSDGLMTFNIDYNVDNSEHPSEVVLTVICKDTGIISGQVKSSTAQITLSILDANDNAPEFPSNSYTITVTDTTEPGTIIGTITPSDIDSTSNGEFYCDESAVSGYGSYFSVGSACNVILTKTPDFDSGQQTRLLVYARDKGSPQLTSTTTVDIVYQQTPTTTTTTAATTTEYNFFDHGGNIALFIFTLLMALALLGLLTWCLMNLCCGNVCGGACNNMGGCRCFDRGHDRRERRYPQRQRPETPETPPPKYKKPKEPEPEPEPVTKQEHVYQPYGRPTPMYGMRPYPVRPPAYPMISSAPSLLPGYVR